MKIKYLLALTLVAAISTLAMADIEEARIAYEKKDYATALREVLPLAEQGNARAQYVLGLMYAEGQGVNQNSVDAATWFLKAAEQDHTQAQFRIGVAYYDGEGILQSYKNAAKWFRRAAEQGDGGAQFNLAVMYAAGNGVPQDFAEGAKLLRLAAAQGIAEAQASLAAAYDLGQGVMHSNIAAYALYTVAAKNMISPSAKAMDNRSLLVEKMSPEEISVANGLVLEMLKPGNILNELDRYENNK